MSLSVLSDPPHWRFLLVAARWAPEACAKLMCHLRFCSFGAERFFFCGTCIAAAFFSSETKRLPGDTRACMLQAHHVKASGMYDDVLNGLGVGSACRGDTRHDRLLAGFTATPRRYSHLHLRRTTRLVGLEKATFMYRIHMYHIVVPHQSFKDTKSTGNSRFQGHDFSVCSTVPPQNGDVVVVSQTSRHFHA